MDYTVHGILQARILEWVFFFRRSSRLQEIFHTQGLNPGLLQMDSLLAEPPGKLTNTGVGSLSFLQQIFPTQESNQGLILQADPLLAELPGKPLAIQFSSVQSFSHVRLFTTP